MTRRLAQLFRLLSLRARVGLGVTAALIVVERLILAAGAFGLAGRLAVTWAATAGAVVVWALRGFVRQSVIGEAREKLTMVIATAALEHGGDGSFLPGEEADAAVFEGRNAAEQLLVRHSPALVAEPIAALVLLYVVKPAGTPIFAGACAILVAAVLVASLRNFTVARQRGAWRKYMDVARDTLTSIRAAPELIASGHEKEYLEKLQRSVQEWTESAARAERSAALFQRIPFAAVVVVGLALIVQTQTLALGQAIRLGVFFPPLAGLVRSLFDLAQTAPRIQTLGRALDARDKEKTENARQVPPPLPCEIRFDNVSFAYGEEPVLKNVSFVWNPGEVWGLKGPNGSGKSTLFKLVLGLVRPATGRILIGGVDLRELDLPAWRRKIAYLPQRPYLPEKATVLEAMRLTAPGLTDDEALRALTRFGVYGASVEKSNSAATADILKTPVATLSAGARQRLMLARVIATSSERRYLLLDEPDEHLDGPARVSLREFASSCGISVQLMVATHDENLMGAAHKLLALGGRSDA